MPKSISRTIRLSLSILSFVASATAASGALADEALAPGVAGAKVAARPAQAAKNVGTDVGALRLVLRFSTWMR